MINLFGQEENSLQQLLDFGYNSTSHSFNRAVIASYNNLVKYPINITPDYIQVYQMKRDLIFLLNKDYDYTKIVCRKKPIISCETQTDKIKSKVTETEYDLEELFTNPSKQVRRGMNSDKFTLSDVEDIALADRIFNQWKEHKMNDPKVFRIAFNPERYLRSFRLKSIGFNIFQKIAKVNGQDYAVINFSIQGDKAFELSFVSLYFNKELKVINDLNDCILLRCFYELYKQGVKTINVGVNIGSKGLKFFKGQFPNKLLTLYTLK